jgi:hypothetical protein
MVALVLQVMANSLLLQMEGKKPLMRAAAAPHSAAAAAAGGRLSKPVSSGGDAAAASEAAEAVIHATGTDLEWQSQTLASLRIASAAGFPPKQ